MHVDRTWQVWGDSEDPVLDGVTEEAAKQYVENNTLDMDDLYVQDAEGNEWEFDGRKWRRA